MIDNYRSLVFSVRFETVIYPFDTYEFLLALESLGYIPPETPEQPVGGRLEIKGIVGRKGGTSVRINPEKMVLGVGAQAIDDLLIEFEAVEKLLGTEFQFDSDEASLFYELITSASIRSENSPLESWARRGNDIGFLNSLSDALGVKVAPFGMRLSPATESPNQNDWFEFRLEPAVSSPEDTHWLEVVYRSANRDAAMAFVKNLDALVDSVLKVVEA